MKTNQKGIELLHHFESCKLQAYLCPAKVWTIGWGNTRYEDGSVVKKGDVITQKRADELFENILSKFENGVTKALKVKLNENQFSALVSFTYNVGIGNFNKSTLLKLINVNPNNPEITTQFLRWNRGGGKVLTGLTRRRTAEAKLYFS